MLLSPAVSCSFRTGKNHPFSKPGELKNMEALRFGGCSFSLCLLGIYLSLGKNTLAFCQWAHGKAHFPGFFRKLLSGFCRVVAACRRPAGHQPLREGPALRRSRGAGGAFSVFGSFSEHKTHCFFRRSGGPSRRMGRFSRDKSW